MNRIAKLSILFLCSALTFFFTASAPSQAAQEYTTISPQELNKLKENVNDILIIDTLPSTKYSKEHLPGAANFEFPNGEMDPWDLTRTAGKSQENFITLLGGDKNRTVVFYCLDDT